MSNRSYFSQVKELVGIPPKPEELIRRWKQAIRKEDRQLDRQIRDLKTTQQKAQQHLKECVKRNDEASLKLMAKEVYRVRRAHDRMVTSKAQLNSLMLQLNHQVALNKVTGSLQRSTEIMQTVNSMVKLRDVSRTMQELSKEMTKAGVIEEMLEDTLGLEDDEEEFEEEAEKEVEKIIFELTKGRLGQAASVQKEEAEHEAEAEEMEKRLQALKASS